MVSIGLFTMPVALAGVILLAARPDRVRGWTILLCAIASGPLLVAWFNRDGPGLVCRNFPPNGLACSDQLNPWPWLAGAVASLGVATVLFVHAGRTAIDPHDVLFHQMALDVIQVRHREQAQVGEVEAGHATGFGHVHL